MITEGWHMSCRIDGASMRYADLRRANLKNANARKTDFSNADLTGALMIGADLGEAILTDVEGFERLG